MWDRKRCITVLALGFLAYFVAYPEDAQAITAPVATILNLTNAIAPSFYGVVAVGIIATAMVKIWGGRAGT